MKRIRPKVAALVVLILFVAGLGGLAWRAAKQTRLNRALIAAIQSEASEASTRTWNPASFQAMVAQAHARQQLEARFRAERQCQVLTLLAQGADPNTRDQSPKSLSPWRLLLDLIQGRGARPSTAPTALMLQLSRTRESGWFDNDVPPMVPAPEELLLVKAMVQHGADINAVCGDTHTSILMAAVDSQGVETTRYLIDRGADVNAQDSEGTTPLMMSAWVNQAVIAANLLDHGARLNECDNKGRTALMYAADANASVVVRLLLERGAMVQLRDKTGSTALMHAANEADVDSTALRYLLARCSRGDLTIRDNEGLSVLQVAQQSGAGREAIRLLK